MKKLLLALAIAAAALPGMPAAADPPHHAPAYGERDRERHRDEYRNQNEYRDRDQYRRDDRRYYDSRGRYLEPRRITRNSYVWRGRDGRYYCRRDNGTTGLIIGAGVGALAGHELAGNGDRTLGALLGGVVGGLLGREIDRGELRCR